MSLLLEFAEHDAERPLAVERTERGIATKLAAHGVRFEGRVLLVRCEQGDLLSVPAGTRHWFDMGTRPHFCAIRMFGTEAGWVATFTGDPIAQRFPSFDAVKEQWP